MSSLRDYADNEVWMNFRRRAIEQPMNDGTAQRWIQGSVGMNSGMPIYSNEYAHLIMKHGSNTNDPYRGGVNARFAGGGVQQRVRECSRVTLDPVGCQTNALRKIYKASHPRHQRPYSPPNSYQD